MYVYIYTNLPVNAIVRLPHPRSRDSEDHETFLAPSADKQTRNYNRRVLKPPSLCINPIYLIYIYIYIYLLTLFAKKLHRKC